MLTDGRTENRTPISHPATSRCDKNKVYPCKPQFNYIKVGLMESKLYRRVFDMVDATHELCIGVDATFQRCGPSLEINIEDTHLISHTSQQ